MREIFGAFTPLSGQIVTKPKSAGTIGGDDHDLNWHHLSVGGDQCGLGWHMHGRTWLGLVHGRKRWHVYGPGNATTAVRSHPLYDSAHWLDKVLPGLAAEQLPQQCTQVGGEVMYLPAAWAHMTLNFGTTIGFGAQEAWSAVDSPTVEAAAKAGDPEANFVLGVVYGRHDTLKEAADWHPLAIGYKVAHMELVITLAEQSMATTDEPQMDLIAKLARILGGEMKQLQTAFAAVQNETDLMRPEDVELMTSIMRGVEAKFDRVRAVLSTAARRLAQQGGGPGGTGGQGHKGGAGGTSLHGSAAGGGSARDAGNAGSGADNGNAGASAADQRDANDPERAALAKLRIKVLRKMLKDDFGDKCAGCKNKDDFVARVLGLRSRDREGAPSAADPTGKDEL